MLLKRLAFHKKIDKLSQLSNLPTNYVSNCHNNYFKAFVTVNMPLRNCNCYLFFVYF